MMKRSCCREFIIQFKITSIHENLGSDQNLTIYESWQLLFAEELFLKNIRELS